MSKTVEELINELQKVKDKSRQVCLSVNDELIKDFYINDKMVTTVYLSNYGEESYKPK